LKQVKLTADEFFDGINLPKLGGNLACCHLEWAVFEPVGLQIALNIARQGKKCVVAYLNCSPCLPIAMLSVS